LYKICILSDDNNTSNDPINSMIGNPNKVKSLGLMHFNLEIKHASETIGLMVYTSSYFEPSYYQDINPTWLETKEKAFYNNAN